MQVLTSADCSRVVQPAVQARTFITSHRPAAANSFTNPACALRTLTVPRAGAGPDRRCPSGLPGPAAPRPHNLSVKYVRMPSRTAGNQIAAALKLERKTCSYLQRIAQQGPLLTHGARRCCQESVPKPG